jgi:hypothetical protein
MYKFTSSSGVAALKQLLLSGSKCCKTTVMELLRYQQQLQELYYGALVNQLLQ